MRTASILMTTLVLFSTSAFASGENCPVSSEPNLNEAFDHLKEQLQYTRLCYPVSDFSDKGDPCVEASVLTPQELSKAFDFLAKIHEIPYDYPEDGCYARALEMARILERDGILSAKVIIEVPHTTTVNASTGKTEFHSTDGKILYAATKNSPKGYVEWIWHIAPVVYLNDGNQLTPMILDPSLFEHPVTVDEWKTVMVTKERPKATLSFHSRFRYGLTETMDDCKQKDYVESDLIGMRRVLKKYRYVADQRKAGVEVDRDTLKDEDFDK